MAFDTFSYDISKLEKYIVHETTARGVQKLFGKLGSYHNNDLPSSWKDIPSGAPQEFVLGPEQFSIFFGDLDDEIECPY